MDKKKPVVPFHKTLMTLGAFLFAAAFILNPQGWVPLYGGHAVRTVGLMYMSAIAMVVFGTVFSTLAALSSRRAHVQRIKAQADEATTSVDDALTSRFEATVNQPAPATSAASTRNPEPRVMVLDKGAMPRVEPSLSAKD